MRSGNKNKLRVVRADITIVGLEGQAAAESRCEHTLLTHNHELLYRNHLGEQLTFSFTSELREAGQTYAATAIADKVISNGKKWRHVGTTATGSTAPVSAKAAINAPDGMQTGSCRIEYSVSARMPYSKPYVRSLDVPLT
ncbi:hypothetical protein [Demequina subtropica]|uniref:hypothetical protein n=1 Tax=Demequina subtropica TaxID=1638989 RepID=UPI000784D177|nr:hypothetical protein [Demequina subtropica]